MALGNEVRRASESDGSGVRAVFDLCWCWCLVYHEKEEVDEVGDDDDDQGHGVFENGRSWRSLIGRISQLPVHAPVQVRAFIHHEHAARHPSPWTSRRLRQVQTSPPSRALTKPLMSPASSLNARLVLARCVYSSAEGSTNTDCDARLSSSKDVLITTISRATWKHMRLSRARNQPRGV